MLLGLLLERGEPGGCVGVRVGPRAVRWGCHARSLRCSRMLVAVGVLSSGACDHMHVWVAVAEGE